MTETLTILRLGVPPTLARTLRLDIQIFPGAVGVSRAVEYTFAL